MSNEDIRDRVDISLAKYEAMKAEIEDLKRKNEVANRREDCVKTLLSHLDIPFESLKIYSHTVHVEKSEDIIDGTTKYMIMFKTDRMV